MADEKNQFAAVQAMVLENLERVQGATQSYIDMVEKAMRGFPGADEDRIATSRHTLSGELQPITTSRKSFCVQRISKKLSAFKSSTFSLN
jgi:hypothetical protein